MHSSKIDITPNQIKISNTRILCRNKRIKTQSTAFQKTQQQSSKDQQHPNNNKNSHTNIFQLTNNLRQDKNLPKFHTLNLSIPVFIKKNKSSKHKIEPYQVRSVKNNDIFVAKLRRKQQARSKILLQRLQGQNRSVGLLELSQTWKRTTKMIESNQDRAETIKQMKKQIRQRSNFNRSCKSSKEVKIRESITHSLVNIRKNVDF